MSFFAKWITCSHQNYTEKSTFQVKTLDLLTLIMLLELKTPSFYLVVQYVAKSIPTSSSHRALVFQLQHLWNAFKGFNE